MAGNKRLVVAYLTENYRENETNEYQNLILGGLHEAAGDEDVSLLYLSYLHNRIPGQPNPQLDFMLDFLASSGVDGILFLGFIHAASEQVISRLKDSAGGVPLMCLGRGIPGIPAVVFDGTSTFLELLDHLLVVHGRRRIVFIPPYNPDTRIDLYRSFMEQHGLQDDSLLLPEQVLRDVAGRERYGDELAFEVLETLEHGKVGFDAIVCTTSRETVCLQQELLRRGRVPGKDVSVVSCEDGMRSRSANPPVTSTSYPWHDVGYKGMQNMVDLLRGKVQPDFCTVQGHNQYRRSCGCESWLVDLVKKFDGQGTDCIGLLSRQFGSGHFDLEGLSQAALRAVETGHDQVFLDPLLSAIGVAGTRGQDLFDLENFLLVVRNCLAAHLTQGQSGAGSGQLHDRLEVLLLKAHAILRERIENQLERRMLDSRITLTRIQRLGQDLITTFDRRQLRLLLAQRLASLDLKTCHMLVRTHTDTAMDSMELFFSSRNAPNGQLHWGKRPGLARAIRDILLPQDSRATLILLPLALEGELMGMTAFETGPLDGSLYVAMAAQLSTAYKSVSLVEQLNESTLELQRSQTWIEALNHNLEDRIRERTAELSRSNEELSRALQELTDTQDRLVHSEKMAALAKLMGAVAHELNTPLGVIISAASFLDSLAKKLGDRFDRGLMSRAELGDFLERQTEALRLIQQNISKANAHISQFKALSPGQALRSVRVLELKPFLEATLFDMKSRHPELKLEFTLACPRNLMVNTIPEALVQVFENLVHWSITRRHGTDVELDLLVRTGEGQVFIRYRDPVCQTCDDPVRLVMDPERTDDKGAGGSLGLELGIAWSTVTQFLGGKVELVDNGCNETCFEISLPLI